MQRTAIRKTERIGVGENGDAEGPGSLEGYLQVPKISLEPC